MNSTTFRFSTGCGGAYFTFEKRVVLQGYSASAETFISFDTMQKILRKRHRVSGGGFARKPPPVDPPKGPLVSRREKRITYPNQPDKQNHSKNKTPGDQFLFNRQEGLIFHVFHFILNFNIIHDQLL